MKRMILWVPLALFALFVATVAWRLGEPANDTVKSRMVGEPLPPFALPAALPGRTTITSAPTGELRLVNIFASWCVPCIAEAPQLLELERRGIPIDAIAIRDRPEDIAEFLVRWGDPFRAIGSDTDSSVQFALGSAGVPETFIVDGEGVIRYQHIGEIRADQVDDIVKAYEAAR